MLWNGNTEGFVEFFAQADAADEELLGQSLESIPDGVWASLRTRLEQLVHQEKQSYLRAARPSFNGRGANGSPALRVGFQKLVSVETKERLLITERLRREGMPLSDDIMSGDGPWATLGAYWPWPRS